MPEFPGARVLLVEDEGAIALLLEDMLEELGCEIAACVPSIAKARQAMDQVAINLAILDVNVAGEPSFDVARVLLERGVSIIFSTGYGMAGLPEDLRTQRVLTKPFTLADLRNVIPSGLK